MCPTNPRLSDRSGVRPLLHVHTSPRLRLRPPYARAPCMPARPLYACAPSMPAPPAPRPARAPCGVFLCGGALCVSGSARHPIAAPAPPAAGRRAPPPHTPAPLRARPQRAPPRHADRTSRYAARHPNVALRSAPPQRRATQRAAPTSRYTARKSKVALRSAQIKGRVPGCVQPHQPVRHDRCPPCGRAVQRF